MWEVLTIALSCAGFAVALAVLVVEIPEQLMHPRGRG